MSGLLIPDHILADMERETQADTQIGRAREVDRQIKEKYPNCELVWVGERATAPGLVPARWHVRRRARDQGHMDSYIPWVGPNGEYREPDSSIVEALRRGDLWNRDVVGELRRAREDSARAVEKAQQALSEERIDRLATNIKSRVNPGVSFSDARPWTNRVNKLPGD